MLMSDKGVSRRLGAQPQGVAAAAGASYAPEREASPRSGLSERVAEQLGREIVCGQPPAGAVMPSEFELCGRLGVSRSALREGLRLLAAKGLIVSRKKLGTMVRPQAQWNMLDTAVLSWHLAAAPTDAFVTGLFELRHIVEPAVASLAAQRASPDALAAIAEALRDMGRSAGGAGDLVAADLRFHEAVLAAADNNFLASFGAVIESALSASFRLSWDPVVRATLRSLAQHEAVFVAIRDRRPEAARLAMAALLDSAVQDVRRLLAERRQGHRQ